MSWSPRSWRAASAVICWNTAFAITSSFLHGHYSTSFAMSLLESSASAILMCGTPFGCLRRPSPSWSQAHSSHRRVAIATTMSCWRQRWPANAPRSLLAIRIYRSSTPFAVSECSRLRRSGNGNPSTTRDRAMAVHTGPPSVASSRGWRLHAAWPARRVSEWPQGCSVGAVADA